MKTFSINTLGCKVNQYESQQIRQLCEHFGLCQVAASDSPDLIAVNTCCVTHTASSKSRSCIRRAQKHNPNATIIVFGCMPQVEQMKNMGENVHLIEDRDSIATELSTIIQFKTANWDLEKSETSRKRIRAKNGVEIKDKSLSKNVEMGELGGLEVFKGGVDVFKGALDVKSRLDALKGGLDVFKGHVRAFLKVQDGCDGYCSYCVIPQTRPKLVNKGVAEILAEAQQLVKAGHKEIVVTGIFLGAYGEKTVRRRKWDDSENKKLADLLGKLAKIDGLARIRLSSLEPGDVTEELLEVMGSFDNIMPHLHLSLQSGSNEILKKMGRQYRMGEFLEKIAFVKERLDRPAITGDFIVGFPGETESDFGKTCEIATQVGFSKMHVFPFSVRKGTAAEKMQDIVSNKVIKSRCERLRGLGDKLAYDFRGQFIGEEAVVLLEGTGEKISGKAERYFVIGLEPDGDIYGKNELVRVRLLANEAGWVKAEPIK